MFGSSIFRNDPFFNHQNDIMSEFNRMDNMMHEFRSSFGLPSIIPPAIAGPPAIGGPPAITGPPAIAGAMVSNGGERFRNNEMIPAGFGRSNNMFGNMFQNMDSMFSEMQNNPNTHCYSSSKVVSYSNDGSGQPKYYESTSQTSQGPGGVRKTRKSERNSVTGVDRMAIGHHIYDRGHIIERVKNQKTNEREEKQDFLNMDEEEKDAFHREWMEKARISRNHTIGTGYQAHHRPQRAIESAEYYRNNNDQRSHATSQRYRERDVQNNGRRVQFRNSPDKI